MPEFFHKFFRDIIVVDCYSEDNFHFGHIILKLDGRNTNNSHSHEGGQCDCIVSKGWIFVVLDDDSAIG